MDELRIILAGCVKTKVTVEPTTGRNIHGDTWEIPGVVPIGELYDSPLWAKRRRYAETSGEAWGILSARYGVRKPSDRVESYEFTLGDRDRAVSAGAWPHDLSAAIVRGVSRIAQEARGVYGGATCGPIVLEVHAGIPYVKRVERAIAWAKARDVDWRIEHPVEGLQIGELLRWYNRQEGDSLGEKTLEAELAWLAEQGEALL